MIFKSVEKMFTFLKQRFFVVNFVFLFLYSELVLVSGNRCCESHPALHTVEIEDGRIRGKLNETLFDNKSYYSFLGIPFAKPPIDELRFKVIY